MLDHYNLKQQHLIFSEPRELVEHRNAFSMDHAELNVFETRTATENFALKFTYPLIVSMIEGKKIMHLRDKDPFSFVPGETIVMPSNEEMHIDFPDSTPDTPTRCLALSVSEGFVQNTLEKLNYKMPLISTGEKWDWTEDHFHLLNNQEVTFTLNRLIAIFVGNHCEKQFFASNATQELIVQLLQTKARNILLSDSEKLSGSHRLAYVIEYIRKNLDKRLSVKELAEKACLSRAQFFRAFQHETGMTPVYFINKIRIGYAKFLLKEKNTTITDACYRSGFNNLNYFSKMFRRFENVNPSSWQQRVLEQSQAVKEF